MAADLHCHTKLSDGSVGIEDLIVIAQKSGIETIAITDHDCLAEGADWRSDHKIGGAEW